MFTAALFKTAKIWKQPKCPSTEEWIKKMWYIYIYNGILLSHKKERNFAICSNMDGLGGDYATWNKLDGERQIPCDVTYMWNLKKYDKLVNITKKKQTHRYRGQSSSYQCVCGGRTIQRLGGWEVQTIEYKIGSRMYCATWGIEPIFCNNCKWEKPLKVV